MRTIFLLFDSLNRKALSCYGGKNNTPNFDRLSKKSVKFCSHYGGSLPCMPARRDFHTGRYNFFHSSWGPMEPYDNSLPSLLRENNGTYSHLITDHLHYFEDGGNGYHTKYDTWEFVRGQEYDPWVAEVNVDIEEYSKKYDPRHYNFMDDNRSRHKLQHAINKEYKIHKDEDYPLIKCFDSTLEFLDINKDAENWFLQVECFDPHEPFDVPPSYLENAGIYNDMVLNWPNYSRVVESPEEVEEIRKRYAALISFCDDQLGRLLDYMDDNSLWNDTAIVMTTDHGYLLSEHDWWAKTLMPQYQEISHIPLMIYHPDYKNKEDQSRVYTSSAIDMMPTIMDIYKAEIPREVQGQSLVPLLESDCKDERTVACGIFGGACLITDGKYAYHYFPEYLDSTNLYEYRIHPCHMRSQFTTEELSHMELYEGFNFTKGLQILKIKARDDSKRVPNHDAQGFQDIGTRLFDLEYDPEEASSIENEEVEKRLISDLTKVMHEHNAPAEMFERFGLHSLVSEK